MGTQTWQPPPRLDRASVAGPIMDHNPVRAELANGGTRPLASTGPPAAQAGSDHTGAQQRQHR